MGAEEAPPAAGSSSAGDSDSLPFIRWGLLATAVFAILLALVAGSVVRIWHDLGSVGTPVLLLPLALGHTRVRLPERAVLLSMVLSGGTALGWLVAGSGQAFLGVEAIFPGLVVSVVVLVPSAIRCVRR